MSTSGPGPFRFSKISLQNMELLHPVLKGILQEVIKYRDFRVLAGARDVAQQRRNIAKGVSKTMNSMHLLRDPKTGKISDKPNAVSFAVDLMRWPIDWDAIERGLAALKRVDPEGQTAEAYELIGFIQGFAAAKGVRIRSGSDWDMDTDVSDQTFNDLPHHELRLK